MKKLTPVFLVFILIAVWYIFIGKELLSGLTWSTGQTVEQNEPYAFPCSEANLVRLIVNSLGEKIESADEALWYEPYYSTLEDLGVTCLNQEEAFNIVSSEKLEAVLKEITDQEITLEDKEQMQLYEVIDTYKTYVTKGKTIESQSLTILETPDTGLPSWEVLTDKGTFYFEGLIIEPLKDQKIIVAYIEDALLGVMAIDHSTAEVSTSTQEVAKGPISLDTIRVLLSNDSGSYNQKDVVLKSDKAYDIVYEGKASELKANEEWKASQFNFKGEKTIYFVPRNEESQLVLTSIEKNKMSPKYYGIMEVTKVKDSYQIVNEVNMERYVAGVLPSEMPTSYGKEALKAQAIAIRTYGASSKSTGRFTEYNADVDDTTASQVYNRIMPDELAEAAAQETAGLILKSDDELINNKFFASSCGYTANYGEVWASDTFPSDTPNYLIAEAQYLDKSLKYNLQKEQDFTDFIKLSADKVDAFDSGSPWFRWQVTLSAKELENLIKPALEKLITQYSNRMTYHQSKQEIGTICDLIPEERGKGGNLMRLKIVGTKGSVTVETEYLIRSLFASNNKQSLSVTRANGTTAEQLTLLPSAFFAIETSKAKDDTIKSVTLYGGGNGHGVGLSQDGAKGMAERGYKCEDILKHYYNGCEIVKCDSL